MANMNLAAFLAILATLTNNVLVHSYTPDGVNLNMVPMMQTDFNDRNAYKISDDGKFINNFCVHVCRGRKISNDSDPTIR